jgi:hypothetical protein
MLITRLGCLLKHPEAFSKPMSPKITGRRLRGILGIVGLGKF